MARVVFRVQYVKSTGKWVVKRGSDVVSTMDTKADAVERGRAMARATWEQQKQLSQLMIHNQDGEFENEHTYGQDPRSSPG
jgi:hypothetical protein